MPRITKYGTTLDGHDIELEFDQKLIVLNRARLRVDGEQVDALNVVYGDKELTTTLADGTEITVKLDSGMVGELVRAQVRRTDGAWVDLEERP